MSRISTYEVVPVPKLADKLIGTSVGGEIEDVTYNFTLQELLNLFIPFIPANNLQGVLDFGNTATQDINLFGTITTTNLDVTNTSNLFITYLNDEVHVLGSLFDSNDFVGTAGQVLTSTGSGVEWYTLPPIFTPNLQQVLTEGNTANVDIVLTSDLSALDVSSDTATFSVDITIDGTLTDGTASVGTSGKVLSSTGTGVQWVDLPIYSATSPLFFNPATGVFSIQVANATQNGYLSSADWITFDGKQGAITLTTTGTSGAATLIGNTLNIPDYGGALSGYVPYTGATQAVNLGAFDLTVNDVKVGIGGGSQITNTLVGRNSLQLNTTGGFNTAIGLSALSTNTTGNSNTAIGVNALESNNSSFNTAIGVSSLRFNSSGQQNTAIGVSALYSNTIGSLNTAIGDQALYNNTNGDNNVAVGVGAGSNASPGSTPNTSSQRSIYIGHIALALTASSINEIVIGASAIGNGSNTVTIGDSTITDNYLKGNVRGGAFIKLGGTSTQFLKADGSVDSTVYGIGTVTSVSALTLGTTGTDLSSTVANGSTTPVITLNVPTASATNRGALSSTDWTTFNSKQNTITLTTSGSSGASTFISNTLNVPTYTLSGLGGVPTTRTLTINGTSQDLSADRTFSVGTVTSVGLTMPAAFSVASSPITSSGTIAVTGAGLASQYIRGDGQLADFPTGGGGGGSSVSYYLNGSVNQGTFVGNTYYEMNKTPIFGAGTDFNIAADGYVAQFITDANDPNSLLIPAGNWNLEFYFSASSGGGTPTFYAELYKYDGTTFTLIADNSTNPELIAFGTTVAPYFSPLAVPETVLLATDRLAIRIYVVVSGRTITLHTENSNLSQVITTFTTGLQALNGLTKQTQYFAVGTSGTDFAISSSVDTHTFNLPTASATNRGALSSANWTTFNSKQDAITLTTTGSSGASTFISNTLNVPNYTLSGLGGVPTTRQLTINGTAYDLSADRSWSVGTVTSVGATAGTGISVSGSPITSSGSLTITNTAPDQTVVLTAGTGISTSGTYPNFTITNTSPSSGGTVTSVAALTLGTSGTDLSSTVANSTTTPVITLNVPTASATNRGALSSGDWTTFNGKQDALSGTGIVKSTAGVISYLTDPLPIANGGTGSATQNFVDLTTDQTIAGFKTFSNTIKLANGTSNAFSLESGTTGNYASLKAPAGLGAGIIVTLPSVTGTLALTSDLSGYLPLTGGTLTGALSGTSATFSGLLTSTLGNNTVLYNSVSATTGYQYANIQSGNARLIFGIEAATSAGIFTGTLDNSAAIGSASATGAFHIASNSIVRQTVFSGGNVGIGTTTDAGFKLDVNGTARLGALTGTSATFSGKITVNLTSAASALDLINTSTNNIFTTYGNASNNTYIGLVGNNGVVQTNNDFEVFTGASYTKRLTIASTGAATFSSSVQTGGNIRTLMTGTTDVPSIYAENNVGSINQIRVFGTSAGGTLFGVTRAGWSSIDTNNGLGLLFGTTDTAPIVIGTSNTERMRITSGGNVGIGTTSPTNPVHIASNTVSQLNVTALSGNTNAQINLEPTGTGIALIGPANPVDFAFRTNATTRLTITSGGNVGIGTASPGGILEARAGSGANLRVRNNGANVLLLQNYNDTDYYRNFQIAASTIQFLTGTDGGGSTSEAMRITSGGNVLIGTTSDNGSKFQVSGAATFSSSVTQSYSVITGAQPGGLGANKSIMDFSGGTARWFSYGADASTNGAFLLNSQRSDGSNAISFLSIASTGAATFSGNVSIAKTTALLVLNDTSGSSAQIGSFGGNLNLIDNATGTKGLVISLSTGAATFSSSAAITGGLAVGTPTQFASSIFFASSVLSAGAGTYPLKWNSSTGIVTYDTSSRLVKENIQDSPYGLNEVLQLKARKYFRTDDQKEEIGFIADEVQNILPEFVPMVKKSIFTKNEEDIELIAGGVNYEKLTAVLVKAIQEQQVQIENLKLLIK